jgi:uncharacterized membrane protein
MHLRKSMLVIAGILVLTFAVSLIAWPSLPERMASHWGFSGEADGYLPKLWGLFLVPLLSAALALLFLVIPRIDPLRANIAEFRGAYDRFIIVFLLFLLYVQSFIILWNEGIRASIGQALPPAFGALFYEIGVLVGQAKPNWFIGIRTPWTLSSQKVWERTHALGGRLFRIAGVITLLGVLLPALAFLFILAPVLLVSVCLVVYSYREYRREETSAISGNTNPP